MSALVPNSLAPGGLRSSDTTVTLADVVIGARPPERHLWPSPVQLIEAGVVSPHKPPGCRFTELEFSCLLSQVRRSRKTRALTLSSRAGRRACPHQPPQHSDLAKLRDPQAPFSSSSRRRLGS